MASVEYRAGSDARTVRDAMDCFATGVTVVTTVDGAGAPVGFTCPDGAMEAVLFGEGRKAIGQRGRKFPV